MQNTLTNELNAADTVEPSEFNRKIGSTTYVVAVYSSRTSTETFEDKILRLIESEVRESA